MNAPAPFIMKANRGRILVGDVRRGFPAIADDSVQCVVTSPPYWGLRDYGCEGQLGLEPSPEEYVANLVAVFREVRRVLHPSGTVFLNIGDSYAGAQGRQGSTSILKGRSAVAERQITAAAKKASGTGSTRHLGGEIKAKDMVGIPWLLAFALRADGWYLRSEIIWHKKSPMPSSVKDRPTTSHESIFVLTKSPRYFWDAVAASEPATGGAHPRGKGANPKSHDGVRGREKQNAYFSAAVTGLVERRNMRSVWSLAAEPYKGAHFACFPSELVRRCLSAGVSEKGCCPECMAPWVRIVHSERVATRPGTNTKVDRPGPGWNRENSGTVDIEQGRIQAYKDPARHVTRKVTTGWQPSCECRAIIEENEGAAADFALDPIPCTVFDPFLGSGTTAQVAEHLSYSWFGCELNADYVAQAEARIATVPRCLRTTVARKRIPRMFSQLDLFEEVDS